MRGDVVIYRSLVVGLLAALVLLQIDRSPRDRSLRDAPCTCLSRVAVPSLSPPPGDPRCEVSGDSSGAAHQEETVVVDIARDALIRMTRASNSLTDARLVPVSAAGQPGLGISAVRPGGLFATLGLRSGDVITSIDDGPVDLLAFLDGDALADRDVIDMSVQRAGDPRRVLVLLH